MNQDNSAARLHSALKMFHEIAAPNVNITCIEIWRKVFNCSSHESNVVIVDKIAKTMSLPLSIQQELAADDPVLAEALAPKLQKIANAFLVGAVDGPASTFVSRLTTDIFSDLVVFSSLAHTQVATKKLNSDDLESIRSRFAKLDEEIRSGNFDKQLKTQLLTLTRRILNAIDDYQISGIQPIVTSIQAAIGQIHFDEQLQDHVRATSFGENLLSAIVLACSIVSGVADAGPAFSAIEKGVETLRLFLVE